MKIETITISGLRSHRGDPPTVVDLSGKSLVAVVGPTGAGKSSILEAICFALYGEATFGGKAYKELSADGRCEIAVQMIFTVGEDRYQLVRTVAPNRSGVFGAKATWFRKVDGDGNALTHVDQVRRVDVAIRALLGGMDRLQFCQAVLLAQNRFAELLETDERKRNELLDILLGLTALADARKALQVTDRAVQRNEDRLADRRSVLPADPATVAAESAARSTAMAELAEQAGQVAHTLGELLERAATLTKDAGDLNAAAALTVAGRDGYDALVDVEAAFGELAEEDARIAGELDQAAQREREASMALEQAKKALALAEEEHGKAGSHDVALQQLGEFASRIGERSSQEEVARRASEQLAGLESRIEGAKMAKSEADTTLAAKEGEAEAASGGAEATMSTLSERRQDIAAAGSLAEQLAGLARGLQQSLDHLVVVDAEAGTADGDAGAKEATWRRALAGLERAQQAASAAAAAHGHSPGDPCPVCNSKLPVSWEPPTSPDIEAARQAEDEARDAYELSRGRKEAAARRHGEAAGEFKTAASTLTTKADELTRAARARSLPPSPPLSLGEVPSDVALAAAREIAGKAAAAAGPIDNWRAGLGDLLEPLEEAASAAKAKAKEADGAVKQARDVAERAGAAVSELATERAGVDQARASAESAADAATARIRSLLEDIPERLSALVDPEAAEPVGAAKEVCLNDKQVVEAAEEACDTSAGALDGVKRRIVSLNAEKATRVSEPLAAARSQLSNVIQVVVTLTRMVELPVSGQLPVAATPAQCLESARSVTALAGEARRAANERVQDLERQRSELAPPAKASVERLLGLKAKADPDGTWIEAPPDPYDPLSAATSAAVQRLVGAAGTAAAAAQREAEGAEKAVEAARNLDKRLGALRSWRSDLAAAIEVLKKDNFPAWARDRRIAELVEVASQLLGTMTGGRYRFDSHLRICDEVAGAVRSATTLSGGEKFEAALALALGVAEIAGRSGIRFDTLFLDEGFSGLDQQNLDRALDAIETEVEQGRRVVLITHIGAVADRIRDVLYVEPDGTGGSKTRWLGEEERFELGADLDVTDAGARR